MSDNTIRTTELHNWLDRMKAGDSKALDGLMQRVSARLERISRKMFSRYRRLSRWMDADDVLQNATLRLIKALQAVRPNTTREFYSLAATQIRRELLDVTKSLFGPEGAGHNHDSVSPNDSAATRISDPKTDENDSEFELWCEFHRQVDSLPEVEREVVGFLFYHGWKQQQVADFYGVTVRTVQRWWQSALERLHAQIHGQPAKSIDQ
jgi:RNA polymerase sigma factor (sigma-70 family)